MPIANANSRRLTAWPARDADRGLPPTGRRLPRHPGPDAGRRAYAERNAHRERHPTVLDAERHAAAPSGAHPEPHPDTPTVIRDPDARRHADPHPWRHADANAHGIPDWHPWAKCAGVPGLLVWPTTRPAGGQRLACRAILDDGPRHARQRWLQHVARVCWTHWNGRLAYDDRPQFCRRGAIRPGGKSPAFWIRGLHTPDSRLDESSTAGPTWSRCAWSLARRSCRRPRVSPR